MQKVPPPRALFTGFGDSSLDFRLFAWVESVDIGLQAQNGLRTAVLRALGDCGYRHSVPAARPAYRYAPPGPEAASALKVIDGVDSVAHVSRISLVTTVEIMVRVAPACVQSVRAQVRRASAPVETRPVGLNS